MEKKYISVPDAARKYGCTQNKLRMAARRGIISKYKQLGRIYFDADELDEVFKMHNI